MVTDNLLQQPFAGPPAAQRSFEIALLSQQTINKRVNKKTGMGLWTSIK